MYRGHLYPTMHELSETCLQKELEETKEKVEDFKRTCKFNACSLTINAWSDRQTRNIMNMALHYLDKACFLSSHDVSANKHDAKYICDYMDKTINKVGEENVVQSVIDWTFNNMVTLKLSAKKRKKYIFDLCNSHYKCSHY